MCVKKMWGIFLLTNEIALHYEQGKGLALAKPDSLSSTNGEFHERSESSQFGASRQEGDQA